MSKILFYMPTFRGGGAERNGVLLCKEFARRGHHILIVVDRDGGPNRTLVPSELEVRELEGGRHLSDTLALRRVLVEFKPEFVYARVGISPLKMLLASVGVSSWRNILISYHSSYWPQDPLGGRLTYWLAWGLTRVTRTTISVSQDIQDELVQRFYAKANKTRVIHNPVDIGWIEMQARGCMPDWLNGRKYLLAAGRLIAQKDFQTLIKAYALICDRIEQDLLIIGEGPLRQRLTQQIAEQGLTNRIYLTGYLENPFPVFKNADLFILSSAFEGFGNVIIEALTVGTPVVSTRCPGGPREILEAGKYGPLVPVGDVAALAGAILATLANPVPPNILKERASMYSLDKVAEQYLKAASC